jgi:hypothetical protein
MLIVPSIALAILSPAEGSPRRFLARRVASAVAVMVVATLGLATTPALADDCPNAALRAQNNSTQLPGCRAYEQVTPVFKEGYAPAPTGFTDDGRLSYVSNGNYANNGNGTAGLYGGNAYLATRTGSGWSTTALAPSGPAFVPASPQANSGADQATPLAFSTDMRSTLWDMRRLDQPDDAQDLYVRDPGGVFTRIGSAPDQPGVETGGSSTVAASGDLSHVVFSVGAGATYEFVRSEGDQRRAVSVDNAGQSLVSEPACGSTRANGVSTDGRVIFVTCRNIFGGSDAVYARVGGTTTIAVSGSQCTRAPSDLGGACGAYAPAAFAGASVDGTRAYFTTSQQLVNGDTDDTNDLYECHIPPGAVTAVGAVTPCPDLREVSGAASGAGVQAVTVISVDGSRVYFVATGVLASNLGANDAGPVAGGSNLYVWTRDDAHPGGETRFVASADIGLAQMTGDGRYLVFVSAARLIDHGLQADTDAARDVYRYDAETGALSRLSIGADGTGGNEPGAIAHLITARHGAISDDGRSVVFTTEETLAPNDTNGTADAYLWRDGGVSLISSGKPSDDHAFLPEADLPFGAGAVIQTFISSSGRDVFFTTTAQMIPSDVDTAMDTYDARVDGGFEQSTPPKCSGEGCQGPLAAPPPATRPDSTSPAAQDGAPQTAPAFSVGRLTAAQLRRIASTGKVPLRVTTTTPGTLSATATATIARRPSTVGSVKRSVAKAGTVTVTVTLTLSKKARAELKRKRKLMVKVLVGQDNVAIPRTVSLKVTQPKSKPKKSSKRRSGTRTSAGGRS